tara:strand:- start:8 stop:1084 length:1077 start_codon:yes stop_codon:yes gene_type:complete
MSNIEINDTRTSVDFKGITFSKFKKTDVKKELLNSLISSKIEPACYWSAELICAGHYIDLWDTIIFFYCNHVHLGNPKIAVYLELRINNFKDILTRGYEDAEIEMRNDDKIRRLFCEIMCILCDAKRKHSYDIIKINKCEFDMVHLRDKFKAPDNKFAEDILSEEDPQELFPAINEVAFNISVDGANPMNACYWVEWVVEFAATCKQRNEKMVCDRRIFSPVGGKYQSDIIWIIWQLIINESLKRSKLVQKTISALLTLFSLKYTSGCVKRRRPIIYFAISLLCETSISSEEIMRETQKEIVGNILSKIDLVYKQIKKCEEINENIEIFKDAKTINLERTIEKLEKMNSFGETFIPRI